MTADFKETVIEWLPDKPITANNYWYKFIFIKWTKTLPNFKDLVELYRESLKEKIVLNSLAWSEESWGETQEDFWTLVYVTFKCGDYERSFLCREHLGTTFNTARYT